MALYSRTYSMRTSGQTNINKITNFYENIQTESPMSHHGHFALSNTIDLDRFTDIY